MSAGRLCSTRKLRSNHDVLIGFDLLLVLVVVVLLFPPLFGYA